MISDPNNQSRFYESGGSPPLPQYMQDVLRKCELGHVYVGSTKSQCPVCGLSVKPK